MRQKRQRIVQNVTVFVCTQCGEDYIDNPVSIELEKNAERARRQGVWLEMVLMGGGVRFDKFHKLFFKFAPTG